MGRWSSREMGDFDEIHDTTDVVSNLSTTLNDKPVAKLSEIEETRQKTALLLQDQHRRHIQDLFQHNNTRSIKIAGIVVENSQCIREPVLQTHLEPLSEARNLGQLSKALDKVYISLMRSGTCEDVQINTDSRGQWGSAIDVFPTVHLVPVKKFMAKTGTNVGNGEGDGYMQFQLRNIFGGGENLTLDATAGTRTRSSYLANFSVPLSPSCKWDNLLFVNSRKIDFASQEQLLRGWRSCFKNENSEYALETVWRSITCVKNTASDYVLASAGDDIKSALTHQYTWDTTDGSFIPSLGSRFKFNQELSFLGTSRFYKTSLDALHAASVGDVVFNVSCRGGFIKPFSQIVHPMDKFHLGGPNDIRSFNFNGLGPRDLNDTLGGDFFVSYGASAFLPIRGNFKLHLFTNAGRLVNDPKKLFSEHSASVGFGIAFNHPAARFEANLGVPLLAHASDATRKGFQYGIGLSFL